MLLSLLLWGGIALGPLRTNDGDLITVATSVLQEVP